MLCCKASCVSSVLHVSQCVATVELYMWVKMGDVIKKRLNVKFWLCLLQQVAQYRRGVSVE